MTRHTEHTDAASILAIVEGSGQFEADGLAHVRNTLEQHLAGSSDAIWLAADDGEPVEES